MRQWGRLLWIRRLDLTAPPALDLDERRWHRLEFRMEFVRPSLTLAEPEVLRLFIVLLLLRGL